MIRISGPGAGRPHRAAWRLGVRGPEQPDRGRVAVVVRAQDQEVRLHTQGLRQAPRHDQSLMMDQEYQN